MKSPRLFEPSRDFAVNHILGNALTEGGAAIPEESRMKIFLIIGVALVAGCAAHPDPIVDMKGVNVAQYEEDLAQCKSYGDEVKVEKGVAKGAATGAVVGAVVGAIGGNADRGAGYGGAYGGTKSGVSSQREKEQVVKRCMRGRGYKVLN